MILLDPTAETEIGFKANEMKLFKLTLVPL